MNRRMIPVNEIFCFRKSYTVAMSMQNYIDRLNIKLNILVNNLTLKHSIDMHVNKSHN